MRAWVDRRPDAAGIHQANKPLHIVVMAEQSVKTASLGNVSDRSGPDDLPAFDRYGSAWHAVAR
jgi:hypothetical protein